MASPTSRTRALTDSGAQPSPARLQRRHSLRNLGAALSSLRISTSTTATSAAAAAASQTIFSTSSGSEKSALSASSDRIFEQFKPCDLVHISAQQELDLSEQIREVLQDPTAPDACKKKAQEAQVILSEMQIPRKLELLSKIQSNENNIWYALALGCDCIVAPNELFLLIASHVKEHDDPSRVEPFIDFCLVWVEANQHTLWYEQTKETLIGLCGYEMTRTLEKTKQLLATLQTPVCRTSCVEQLRYPFHPSPVKFELVLEKIAENKFAKAEYTQIVQQTAQDLYNLQLLLFSPITAHHLIRSKWPDTEISCRTHAAHFNALSEFVIDSILAHYKKKQRAGRILSFFADVSFESLKLRDLCTAASLYSAFSRHELSRIQTIFDQSAWCKYSTLETLFRGDHRYKALRETIDEFLSKKIFFIPLLSTVVSDVAFTYQIATLTDDSGKRSFHYFKLFMLYKIACDAFSLTASVPKPAYGPFASNICSLFMEHKPQTQQERDRRSHILQ